MTWLKPKTLRRAVTIACLLTIVGLQLPAYNDTVSAQTSKEASSLELNQLAARIADLSVQLRANPSDARLQRQYNNAVARHNTISVSMGGDRGIVPDPNHTDADEVANVAPPVPANCAGTTTSFSNTTPVVVPTTVSTVTSTIAVAGAGTFLWDVDAVTNLVHSFNADVDMTITSPAGTVVTLTTDNGSSFNDVFNGTTWDDDADPGSPVPYASNNNVVSDRTTYADGVTATPLVPEEAMGAFIGENPNGTWTLTISDDLGGDGGSVTWSLNIVHLAAPPAVLLTSASNTTPVVVPTTVSTVTSTIAVAGATGSIVDVNATTNLVHSFNADVDMTITSPAGTVVTLTTDNGSSFNDVFNGTVWDDDADPGSPVPYSANNNVVSDRTTYADGVLASPLVPEEAMGAFVGENPNGTWTLTISDDLGGDGGSVTWSLAITSGECMAAPMCQLTCPGPITASATSPAGAVVTYAPTASNCGPVTCVPPSGTTFAVGTTTVTCTETASSSSTTTLYSSGNINVPVPTTGTSGPMAQHTLAVADPGTVTDVNFRFRMDHTFTGDLFVTLTGPNNTVVTLVDNRGGGGDNFGSGATDCSGTKTVLDDEAATPIGSGASPFAGSFRPETVLSALDGQAAAGNWRLNVQDEVGGDLGALFCWELEITRQVSVAGASCSFPITVNIPFDFCMLNDGPADQAHYIRAVISPSAPAALRGYYQVRRANASGVYCGTANQLTYVPGRSLIMNDTDDPHQTLFLNANLSLRSGSATHTIQCSGFQQTVIRDRNTADSSCEFATFRPCIVLCP